MRPVAGVVVAALQAGRSGSLPGPGPAAGAAGGSAALMSHLVRARTRTAVNASHA